VNATLIGLVLVAIVVLAAIVGLLVRARRAVGPLEEPTRTAPPAPVTPPPEDEAVPAEGGKELPEAVDAEADVEAEVESSTDGDQGAEPTYKDRLGKSRGLFGALRSLRGRRGVDAEALAELEDALLRSDVGVATTDALVASLRSAAEERTIDGGDGLLHALRTDLVSILTVDASGLPVDRGLSTAVEDGRVPVWLFVGVNGVGKTTTIGKLAARESAEGRRVVLAAGDTFRAAAADQLGMWAERSGAEIVRGSEGGDPSSVVFDAIAAAGARGADLVLADTAGRLHTKVNLVEELKKIRRVADREPGQVTEVLLVLDATTGQNGITQARQFGEAVDATGVVLTKLDGTARGGVVIAIQRELGLPVKLVGLGEQAGDLVPFDPESFVDALLEP